MMVANVAKADTITASLFTPQVPTGTAPVLVDLNGITVPSSATINGTGFTVMFSVPAGQGVVQGTIEPIHAVPVGGVTGTTPEYLTGGFGSPLTTNIADSGNYLSTGTGTITITFASPETSLALLWGSIDSSNDLKLNDAANFDVTGTAVQAAAAGFISNGFQGPGGSAYVVIDTDTPFTTVTLTSGVVSFESAGIAANSSPFSTVPEPSNVALIAAAALGVIALVRRRTAGAL
jgi:hypothetical protein